MNDIEKSKISIAAASLADAASHLHAAYVLDLYAEGAARCYRDWGVESLKKAASLLGLQLVPIEAESKKEAAE